MYAIRDVGRGFSFFTDQNLHLFHEINQLDRLADGRHRRLPRDTIIPSNGFVYTNPTFLLILLTAELPKMSLQGVYPLTPVLPTVQKSAPDDCGKNINMEGSKMTNRTRKNKFLLYLSDDERYILDEKWKLSGLRSRAAFLRNLIIYGYVYDVDYSHLHEYSREIARIGNNINQIVRLCSKTGHVYENDADTLE